MTAVMLSLKPEIVQRIIERRQSVIIKLTCAKTALPFKCYVYCKHGKLLFFPKYREKELLSDCSCFETSPKHHKLYNQLKGRVVGEFICEYIEKFKVPDTGPIYVVDNKLNTILTRANIKDIFIGRYYAWHIKDFILYDTPKELDVFKKASKVNPTKLKHFKTLKRPPFNFCCVYKNLEK